MGNNPNKTALSESFQSVERLDDTERGRPEKDHNRQYKTRCENRSSNKSSIIDLNSLRLSRSFLNLSFKSSNRRNKSAANLTGSLAKDAWPIKQSQLSFLPEFQIRAPFQSDSYKLLGQISSGSFGKVYKIQLNDTGTTYALKVLNKSKIIEKDSVSQVKEEIQIQKACGHHPFIVSSPFNWQSKQNLYIVTDFIGGGELHQLLSSYGILPLNLVQLYVYQIALVLDFLHNAGIIYRDLKPENILLDSKGHIQLIDFGLSKWLSYGSRTKTICGTLQYMAPEIFKREPYGHAADWWSLGVIACLMITGQYPETTFARLIAEGKIDCEDVVDDYRSHNDELFELRPVHLNDDKSGDLLTRLLELDPTKRLRSLRTLRTIAFYKGYNFDDVKEKKINPNDLLNCCKGANESEIGFVQFDSEINIEE